MPYESAFENGNLVNTDWHNSGTMYMGLLLPNFFILYFGQKPPTGDVMSDDVKRAFSSVGLGYKTWCTLAEVAINSSLKIATVLSNAAAKVGFNHPAFVRKHFSKNWTGNGMELTAKGPMTPIMLVSQQKMQISKGTSWCGASQCGAKTT